MSQIDDAELALWITAIRASSADYSLPAYGHWMTVERAALMFATWNRDEVNGEPSPALCRRCGMVIHPDDMDGRQVHIRCHFPIPPGVTPPPKERFPWLTAAPALIASRPRRTGKPRR